MNSVNTNKLAIKEKNAMNRHGSHGLYGRAISTVELESIYISLWYKGFV